MNTKIRFSWFLLAFILTLSASLFFASTARAEQPVKSDFETNLYDTIMGLCEFPVSIHATARGTEIDFFDSNGILVKIKYHFNEQDTFSANGKTLVGIPFSFNVEIIFGSDGIPIHLYSDGVVEKIWLPDGSLFISAGRVDFAAHGFPNFIFSPDKGRSGNFEKFCAALAP
jgi:hypothetical protein